MTRWEYTIIFEDVRKDKSEQEDRLNSYYGAYGWELVNVIPIGNTHVRLYFKRPLPK